MALDACLQTQVYDSSCCTLEVCCVSASIPISLFNTPCQKGDMSYPSINLTGTSASLGNTSFTFTDLMKVIAYQSS